MNELDLIHACKRNDPKAQKLLYDKFSPMLFGICRRYIKGQEDAEDVFVNGMFKILTKIKGFREAGSFEGWMKRIMVNESISQLRKDKKLQFNTSETLENSIDHVTYIESELEVNDIQKSIDALPDGYKAVFVLYAIEGYKHSEIAELLNITEGTSKSQLSKARKALQASVNKQNNTHYGTH